MNKKTLIFKKKWRKLLSSLINAIENEPGFFSGKKTCPRFGSYSSKSNGVEEKSLDGRLNYIAAF